MNDSQEPHDGNRRSSQTGTSGNSAGSRHGSRRKRRRGGRNRGRAGAHHASAEQKRGRGGSAPSGGPSKGSGHSPQSQSSQGHSPDKQDRTDRTDRSDQSRKNTNSSRSSRPSDKRTDNRPDKRQGRSQSSRGRRGGQGSAKHGGQGSSQSRRPSSAGSGKPGAGKSAHSSGRADRNQRARDAELRSARNRSSGTRGYSQSAQQSRRRSSAGSSRGAASSQRFSHPRSLSAVQMPTSIETSAGGLVVSNLAESVDASGEVNMDRIYVCLIGRLDRRGRLLWSMPKGHVEEGENQYATAEREVWEETGITSSVFAELGTIDYWFVSDGIRIHKTVHHHLLEYRDGDLNDEDPEVTEVAWVPASELIERLAYGDERKLARRAHDMLPHLALQAAAEGKATPR